MQYEPTLSRAELIDFALNKYFARVDAKDMDAVLDCFHDTALFCVQTAFTRHSGKAGNRQPDKVDRAVKKLDRDEVGDARHADLRNVCVGGMQRGPRL